MNKDSVYSSGKVTEDFSFNDQVAEVFDDMLDRSVPHYQTVIKTTAAMICQLAEPESVIYDLGCSTGSTLLELSRLLPDMNLRFIGLDNAPAMLDKARRKAEMFGKSAVIEFQQQDITAPGLSATLEGAESADVILCNYTMQFIRPMLRQDFVKRLAASLPTGGLLFVSEKIISQHSRLNRTFIDLYHDFKRDQGYSELEIAAKREALENVLIPFTPEENMNLFRASGFEEAEMFFRWINFASFVALKK
ncbi:MAG: carboxy-S-adenosyl-L-methionine synthase CmoA [Candidatus Electrothrix sp. LOE1_4_5]|nr:carboxy-S-adenosyl-L-methionine synthase CmoA [Candidatus Electrothrix gigas]